MSDENEIKESQVVKDMKQFDDWFEANIASIMGQAKEIGLDVKLKQIMRMSWRKCSEIKNKEIQSHTASIVALKSDLASKDSKSEELLADVQRLTMKVTSLEKAVKNIK